MSLSDDAVHGVTIDISLKAPVIKVRPLPVYPERLDYPDVIADYIFGKMNRVFL